MTVLTHFRMILTILGCSHTNILSQVYLDGFDVTLYMNSVLGV